MKQILKEDLSLRLAPGKGTGGKKAKGTTKGISLVKV